MAEVIKGVKLLVEEGRKKEDGTRAEPVAFYGARRGRSSIVFLPKGAVVGKTARVDLLELEKKDVRGNCMYRATPVSAEVSEQWRENADGSLTRFKVSTDWLGDEREVETFESRPKRRRESEAGTRSEFVPIWGSDLVASYVEERQVKVFETCEEEVAANGQLTSRKVSERTEPQTTLGHAIVEICVPSYCGWDREKFQLQWQPSLSVSMSVKITPSAGYTRNLDHNTTWDAAPQWWKDEQLSRYPVCQCGRKRRDTQVADGYGKCEKCRAEDTCSRCGKQAKVTVIDGAIVCDACKVWQTAEVAIDAGLTHEYRQMIAAEAKRLRAGEAYPQSEGEALLRAITPFADTSSRDSFVKHCAGYLWHYATAEGFFATKFSPEALLLLELLPQASGNGLVELCAWLDHLQGVDVGVSGGVVDYYAETQLRGKERELFFSSNPAYHAQSLKEKMEAGKPVLANFLRGNEQDRLALLEAKQWLEEQQKIDSEVWSTLNCVNNALEGNQDYAAALKVVADYRRSFERRQASIAAEAERERIRQAEWAQGEQDRARETEWLSEDERPHFALTQPPMTPRDEYLARRRELEAQHRHHFFGVYGPFRQVVRPSKKDPRRLVWSYVDKHGTVLDADPASRLMVEAGATYLGWISGNVPISAKEKATQIRLEGKVVPEFEV